MNTSGTLEYWAQFFPIERGYSSYLFAPSANQSNASGAAEAGAEEEEEAEEEAEEAAAAPEDNETDAESGAEAAEHDEEKENAAPAHVFGRYNPMIFGDLAPMVNGRAYVSTGRNGPVVHDAGMAEGSPLSRISRRQEWLAAHDVVARAPVEVLRLVPVDVQRYG